MTGMIHHPFAEKLIEWAAENPDIRAMFLFGSRARDIMPADQWSDYDIAIVTHFPNDILHSDFWLEKLARPKISFLEEMSLAGSKERRLLLEDGTDFDLVVFSAAQFAKAKKSADLRDVIRKGYRMLVDKDKLLRDMPLIKQNNPDGIAPHENEFADLCQNFWFHAVWTAKKMRRGEFLQAKYACDHHMKHLLIRMIRWNTVASDASQFDTWHDCRFFENWAPVRMQSKMREAYAHYEERDIWRALDTTTELFRDAAKQTAPLLGLLYPEEADAFARETVRQLKSAIVTKT